MYKTLFFSGIFLLALLYAAPAQNTTVNGDKKYQIIHGLGVNINPQSWNVNPDSVKKVIDSLVDGLGCTSFRLMYDDCDWEYHNDNDDPDIYNWAYYDSVYSLPRFTCVWNTVAYLNSKGISDITLSPDGATPAWMGGTKLIPGMEAEYAEMISSMVNYGINRRKPAIHFIMISPINETSCDGNEGVLTTAPEFDAIYSAVATHLTQDHLNSVTVIGPDDCGRWPENARVILSNPATMSKVLRIGGHSYGNSTSTSRGLIDLVKKSAYPDREVIMTEANAVCNGCDGGLYNKSYSFADYAGPAYRFVLQHLNAGVNGVQIWEGYDSRYHHPNRTLTWSMWGIFGINDTTRPDVYTPRAHFYVFKQLYRFVKPGYQRIDIATELPKMTLSAFYNPADGRFVITGKNDSDKAQSMNVMLKNLSAGSSLRYFYSDEQHHFSRETDVPVKGHAFSKLIPAYCVFTLVSK